MQKKHTLYFDILTIIACLMVVFFHTNGIVYQYSDTLSWRISVAERCIVYSAIPIFFMLSGAKLLGYRSRYSTKEFVKRRFLRIGIPFLFWNLFYVVYHFAFDLEPKVSSAKQFISMLLNSDFQTIYWFFYALFSVYAAIPVLSLILQAPNHRKYLWYTIGICFALNWVLVPLCRIAGISYNPDIEMPICGGYLIYVIFGYLISTEQLSKSKRWTLYILALLGGIIAFGYTVTTSSANGETNRLMFSYHYFPSAFTGAAIFVFAKQLFETNWHNRALLQEDKGFKLIRTVSDCCMGIWLTHPLGIQIAAFLTGLSPSSYIWRFLCPLIIFTVCLTGTYIAKRIPLIKNIV